MARPKKGDGYSRAERQARGSCNSCGNMARPGMACCQACADRYKAKYQAKKNSGLCGLCGNPNTTGQVRCQLCLDKQKAAREAKKKPRLREPRRIRNPLLIASGICLRCETREADRPSKFCVKCKTALCEISKKNYLVLREKGLCIGCRQPSSASVRCPACQQAHNEKQQQCRTEASSAGLCRNCCKNPLVVGSAYCQTCCEQQTAWQRRRLRKLKDAAYQAYGGYRCVDCGVTEESVLQLDHVNEDGAAHRREVKSLLGNGTYSWLKKNNYPPGLLEVRCACCNIRKHRLAKARRIRAGNQKLREEWLRLGVCRECGGPLHLGSKVCAACGLFGRAQRREHNRKLKEDAYNAYGGFRCACCGITDELVLQIDHINQDGAAHRRKMRGSNRSGGLELYIWLKKNGFPAGYRVLCSSCNWSRARLGGVCYHERDRLAVRVTRG